ncbi:MAG TPA: hypothetical protein DDZ80_07715, partial [Cyanobacteria bacterium UBA8803]|nr:hypothetical protein [Cyanobacteria bacterium UBA8803]
TELAALQNGFTTITIGSPDSAGTVTLNTGTTFNAPVTIAGGSTLVGPSQDTSWNITGVNSGNLNNFFPNTLTFSNIENLTGSSGNDTFLFSEGATVTGLISDIGGIDTLNYSAYTSPLTVNLETMRVVGIEQIVGTTAAESTLIGLNAANTWNITGNNSGTVNGTLNFTAFSNITGGNADDIFQFSNGGSISGNLNGGSGNLTLLGDEINLGGNVSGTGNLTIQPLTLTQTIQLGGSDSGSSIILDLTTAELSLLQNGFNAIAIGGSSYSGVISLAGDVTFSDPVTLAATNGSGAINTTGGTLIGTDNATLTLLANQDITTGSIINPGRNITITSNAINTSAGVIDSSFSSGNGGDIALIATGDITTGAIAASAGSQGGTITLTSSDGAVTTGDLNSSGASGGDLTINAATAITTGVINTSGLIGDGGNVTLDPIGDIQVNSINAQGGSSGRGGEVDITTQSFFRATGTFRDRNDQESSISTAGGNGGGDITIRHGGNGQTPFIVGDATTNGTSGAITSGEATITPTQSFPFTHREGNIGIISIGSPVVNPVDLTESTEDSPDIPIEASIPAFELNALAEMEEKFTTAFDNYLGIGDIAIKNLTDAKATLHQVEQATGVKPALIYAIFVPSTTTAPTPVKGVKSDSQPTKKPPPNNWQFNSFGLSATVESTLSPNQPPQDNDQLELVLVTAEGPPIRKLLEGATRKKVLGVAQQFRTAVTDIRIPRPYQVSGEQLYKWLVAPLESELQARQINNLTFLMDNGLRSIPMAALSDGNGFIVERYSVGLMPSLSLTDTSYVDVRNLQVLAMGASQFSDQNPLPAVPVELSAIAGQLWPGKSFLNEGFTLSNLKQARAAAPFGIIHLATHGEFKPGKPSNSYIQFWDTKLGLDQLRQLGLNEPPVELMVLSACRSALGDEEAELGFTGLAVQAGVKSALGSLWYVSDEGTLGLMATFYEQLKQAPIKAEALRQAQLAMIHTQVKVGNGQVLTPQGTIPLPPELAQVGERELTHPYYWSAFTLIGNPW